MAFLGLTRRPILALMSDIPSILIRTDSLSTKRVCPSTQMSVSSPVRSRIMSFLSPSTSKMSSGKESRSSEPIPKMPLMSDIVI